MCGGNHRSGIAVALHATKIEAEMEREGTNNSKKKKQIEKATQIIRTKIKTAEINHVANANASNRILAMNNELSKILSDFDAIP